MNAARGLFGDLPVEAPTATPGFDRFWAAWPPNESCQGRKVGKKKCLTAWNARGYEAQADAILACLKWTIRNMPGWNKRNGEFIPMPYTWLNREPWTEWARQQTRRPARKPAPAPPNPMLAIAEQQRAYFSSLSPERQQEYRAQAARKVKRADLIDCQAMVLAWRDHQREQGA